MQQEKRLGYVKLGLKIKTKAKCFPTRNKHLAFIFPYPLDYSKLMEEDEEDADRTDETNHKEEDRE